MACRQQWSEDLSGDTGGSLDELTDHALLQLVRQERADAFVEVCRRYRPLLARVVAGTCGATHADDIAHEVLTGLWMRPAAYDPERGGLGGYLIRAARYRAVDVARSERSRRGREHLWAIDHLGAGDVESEALSARGAAEIAAAVGRLPDEERRAVVLAFFRGCTYQEVAAILGRPEGTTKSTIRRALRRLRTQAAVDCLPSDWVPTP